MATKSTPTLIMIGDTERRIIETYKAENGLPQSKGTSAAIRQIIRDWAKRNQSQEQSEVEAA